MRDAFDKLKTKGAAKTKKKKRMMTMEIEGENQQMDDEISKSKEVIKQSEVRSIKKGNAKIKKMLLKAYKNELKTRFEQWKVRINKVKKQNGTFNKVMIEKWSQRLYREAFDKFKQKTDKILRDQRVEKKTEDRVATFKKRRINKFFNMLSANRGHNKMTRMAIKPVLERNY